MKKIIISISFVFIFMEADVCQIENNITTEKQLYELKKYLLMFDNHEQKFIVLQEKLNRESVICQKYLFLYEKTKDITFQLTFDDCKKLYKNRLKENLKISEQFNRLKKQKDIFQKEYDMLIKERTLVPLKIFLKNKDNK